MNLLNDPYDCLCCNQTCCKSCIINYIKVNNKCPFSDFFSSKKGKKDDDNNLNELINKLKPSSSNFTKVIQSLKFNCKNQEKGCNAEINIEEISEHEKICKFNHKNSLSNQVLKVIKKDDKENKNKKDKLIINNNLINKSRNNNVIFKKKESKNNTEGDGDKNCITNNTFRDSFNNWNNNNNQLKQQDSIVSFCDLKKNLNDRRPSFNPSSINQEKDKNENSTILNNLKFEKSIEEINQKLSVINKLLTNGSNLKLNEEKYLKINNNNIEKNLEKEVSEFNVSEHQKAYKSNSMAITNNYYDGSYINTINNYSNNSTDKSDYLSLIKNDTQKKPKKKFLALNIKPSKTIETPSKLNKYQKYLKYKKNTMPNKISKNLNKNQNDKSLNLLLESNNKDKSKILNETKTNITLRKNSLNCTPKLGSKSKKKVIDKKYLNINMERNNSINFQNEGLSSLDDILIVMKNLENKMNDIEKILQSNNCLINQEYSIQNNESNNKINLNNQKKEQLNEEKIMKLIEESMNKKEENIKNILKDQIESLKKYLMEQCIDEMRKSILDTNIDIMTLYNDKLDELEKIINNKNDKPNNNTES